MAKLPMRYDNYVFDLYGTLVDIHTQEDDDVLWEKLALFYGYYSAIYEPEELKAAYGRLVKGKEKEMKYSHEACPEIEITEVFEDLFREKGVEPDKELAVHAGQFFRILSTDYVRVYDGCEDMLKQLKDKGKKVYLLSNAQRIFTKYEMHILDIFKYFDGVLISSDYETKKPDQKFFNILFEKYPMDKDKTLFIGNDSTTDIAGATKAGLDTYYINSNISPANDSAPDATFSVDDFKAWEIA